MAHVHHPVNPITPPEAEWFNHVKEDQVEERFEQLGEELRSQGFDARTVFLTVGVQEETLSLAKRECADLIVAGSHGVTGVEHLLLGSDAESLSRKAMCPVLIVGPQVPKPKPIWSPKTIVCAIDLDPENAPTAAYGYRLARHHRAHFTLFHVEDPTMTVSAKRTWSRFKEALARELSDESGFGGSLWTQFSEASNGTSIVEFAREHEADLIVLGARSAPELPRSTSKERSIGQAQVNYER